MISWLTNIKDNFNQQTIINLIIAIVIFVVFNVISKMVSYIIIKLFNFRKSSEKIKENPFYLPLIGFFKITGLYIAILFLRPTFNISENIMNWITKIYKVVVIIVTANCLSSSLTKKSRFIRRVEEKSTKDLDDSSIRILIRILRFVIYVIAGFVIFAEIGYDLSGLVTGLGLGSVVLTIAAQDTIKNLLGGMIIFMDKPFKVGDYIKLSDYQGTVEDMTFRSTRIRTLDNTLIQVPNSLVSSDSIENYSKITKRRYNLRLDIVLDTSMEKIEAFEKKVYELLMQNEDVFKDSINIHFTEIGSNGFAVSIVCYLNIVDYMEFLDIKEELNKEIMKIVNKENLELAYDTKTIEIKK
jgi:MscS family membrane protein